MENPDFILQKEGILCFYRSSCIRYNDDEKGEVDMITQVEMKKAGAWLMVEYDDTSLPERVRTEFAQVHTTFGLAPIFVVQNESRTFQENQQGFIDSLQLFRKMHLQELINLANYNPVIPIFVEHRYEVRINDGSSSYEFLHKQSKSRDMLCSALYLLEAQ